MDRLSVQHSVSCYLLPASQSPPPGSSAQDDQAGVQLIPGQGAAGPAVRRLRASVLHHHAA